MDALWMKSGACVVYSVCRTRLRSVFIFISKDDDELIIVG